MDTLENNNLSDMPHTYLPPSIDLRIIGACNLRCPFCFGPRHEYGPTDMSRLIRLAPELSRFGVRSVIISGGEPLLVGSLAVLLRVLKESGLLTVLSTNGLLLKEKLDSIAPYLDWVALPLDADEPDVNHIMRRGDRRAFSTTLALIPEIRAKYPHLKIKLGTVICRINRNQILGIPELVTGARKPDIWKLYQVSYSSYGEDNREMLQLTDTEFEDIATVAKQEALRLDLPIAFYRSRDRSGKYLFFEPNGDVMVIVEGKELVIGNYIADLDSILQKWRSFVDTTLLWNNVQYTYPGI